MGSPIIREETEEGEERTKLKPSNLDPGEAVQLTLKRVSLPRESEYGEYIFAEVEDGKGEVHRVIISASTKAPGFVGDSETEFGEACHEKLGHYPDRVSGGRSLADCFYEAPTDDDRTKLIRFTKETDDGVEYSTYWFGVPDTEKGEEGQPPSEGPDDDQEIKWREP